MKTIDELFETPIDSSEYWADPYELHKLLRWKPWHPYPVAVWASETPTEIWDNQTEYWPQLRAQLLDLHAEYIRRKAVA